jgi:hypothetical protein
VRISGLGIDVAVLAFAVSEAAFVCLLSRLAGSVSIGGASG